MHNKDYRCYELWEIQFLYSDKNDTLQIQLSILSLFPDAIREYSE